MKVDGWDEDWTRLGWTKDMWDNGSGAPSTETIEWANLTLDEQDAAMGLSYFYEIWDGIPLDEW